MLWPTPLPGAPPYGALCWASGQVLTVLLLADSRIANLDPPGYQRLGEWSASTWPDLGGSGEYNRVRIFQAG